MNELDLLEKHGPAPTGLSAATLQRARAALTEEIAAGNASGATPGSAQVRPLRRRRPWFGVGLVAAAAAGLATVVPSLFGVGATTAVALAPADPLTFPLTPTRVPAGLGEPVFDREPGLSLAVYTGASGDRVMVVVTDERRRIVPDDARPVDVGGHDAVSYGGREAGEATTTVLWQEDDEGWVAVTGSGTYADAEQLESFAGSLRERPQPVDLALELAPQGWEVASYKADHTVTLTPGGQLANGEELTLTRLSELSTDLADDYGAYDVSAALVQGRPAALGHKPSDLAGADDLWVLEARTRDGRPFSLLAPGVLTRAQVLRVAAGVSIDS